MDIKSFCNSCGKEKPRVKFHKDFGCKNST